MPKQKVVVVMPAYNAEKTLLRTYNDIPKDAVSDVLLVDDESHDQTVTLAKKLGIKTYIHHRNRGYGGNQKTCYTKALENGADIVVMIHPDYQYDPKLTPFLVEPIKRGLFDIMLGSRVRSRSETLAGGMPVYKYIGNRFLTLVENIVLGLSLSEYHTGFRAYSRKALTAINFISFSDNFVFDQEMLIVAAKKNLRIGEIAVPVRYFPEASSCSASGSIVYGLETLWALLRYRNVK
ncbi:glycosyl transferase family 2 [Candidatus Gottesmanbacteria bacterium RBG_16_43_7]|uniref:Glycosyl transferase family 2 n=1 Tax=Candidatus Gottesmanbacteria bacterium RBG_16_43_7 TaxID=1798373 RepID=A0A1F5ZC19_9BACT|nr:MAG: glycosyl transferase family 2 [Candidatus Gottesmanbacteria bacterium RBG_16_43_7]